MFDSFGVVYSFYSLFYKHIIPSGLQYIAPYFVLERFETVPYSVMHKYWVGNGLKPFPTN